MNKKAAMKATIEETPSKENGYRYVVETDCGRVLYMAGMGAPKGGKIGDEGTVSYQTGASFGLYFWSPVEADVADA
jgi:hypothetical protein